jgi:hypothetical protein
MRALRATTSLSARSNTVFEKTLFAFDCAVNPKEVGKLAF